MGIVTSLPGPVQLSVACSTENRVLQATESWAGPGNEAMGILQDNFYRITLLNYV